MPVRRLVAAVCVAVALVAVSRLPAVAQTATTSPEQTVTTAVAPGDTAPNGGPLLVPGEVSSGSTPPAEEDTTNSDNTGTIVALVIAGLLVVALLLALLTYWFWRNTRPGRPVAVGDDHDEE